MWLPLILLTAFFVSLQDVIGKKIIDRVDPYIVGWARFSFSLLLLVPWLFVTDLPRCDIQFWQALGFSTVFLTVASIFYFLAIKHSDLSLAVPMQALTPLFLLITSPIILGEFPRIPGLFGIVLIVVGSYILHLKEGHVGFWGPFKSLVSQKGPRYMLFVAIIYSVSGNLDKVGVIHSSPLMWLVALHLSVSIVFGMIILKYTANVGKQIKEAWPFLLVLGLCNGLGLVFQMMAIKMTLLPYLIAVKRTSVIMTSLFGFFLFKEKGWRERLVGAVLMVLGVFMISFFQ